MRPQPHGVLEDLSVEAARPHRAAHRLVGGIVVGMSLARGRRQDLSGGPGTDHLAEPGRDAVDAPGQLGVGEPQEDHISLGDTEAGAGPPRLSPSHLGELRRRVLLDQALRGWACR